MIVFTLFVLAFSSIATGFALFGLSSGISSLQRHFANLQNEVDDLRERLSE